MPQPALSRGFLSLTHPCVSSTFPSPRVSNAPAARSSERKTARQGGHLTRPAACISLAADPAAKFSVMASGKPCVCPRTTTILPSNDPSGHAKPQGKQQKQQEKPITPNPAECLTSTGRARARRPPDHQAGSQTQPRGFSIPWAAFARPSLSPPPATQTNGTWRGSYAKRCWV